MRERPLIVIDRMHWNMDRVWAVCILCGSYDEAAELLKGIEARLDQALDKDQNGEDCGAGCPEKKNSP
jgi:hypothetical protein